MESKLQKNFAKLPLHEAKCERRAKAKRNQKNGLCQNVNFKKVGFLNRFLSCDFAVLYSCDFQLGLIIGMFTLLEQRRCQKGQLPNVASPEQNISPFYFDSTISP
jgi:hypothetical protein